MTAQSPAGDGDSARRADRFADRLTVDSYRLAARAARLSPERVGRAIASGLGPTLAAVMQQRRSMIERHLRRVDPALRGSALQQAVRGAFASYARYYIESFQLPTLSAAVVDDGITLDGFEHVTNALDAGRGVILALPHLGGWEWAGRWMTGRGYPMTVVVEELHPPELFDWFVELRRRLGMRVVPLGADAAGAVSAALRRGETVCLLCDRDVGGGGVEVELFGERTRLPAGPAALARRTGAALLPTAVYFTERRYGHHTIVRPPLPTERSDSLRADVARTTQALACELEHLIRRAPHQWHLFQPNWPSDPGYGGLAGRSNGA